MLNSVLDSHIPLKKMRVREKDVPYITTEWKNAIRKKRKFARKFIKNPTQENLELRNKWRNEATRCRRRAIKMYWKEKADNLKTNPREFYNTFMPFLKGKETGQNTINININDKPETSQVKVAEHFADYFANIAKNIGGEDLEDKSELDYM